MAIKKPQGSKAKSWERMGAREVVGAISWSWAGAEDLQAAVVAATEDGAALLLSKTSDGGALVVQVWSGAGRFKQYPTDMAQLTEVLALIAEIGNS
jgi:hypothetical protein